MKHKILYSIASLTLILLFSLSVHAGEALSNTNNVIDVGYTTDGVYYEVYELHFFNTSGISLASSEEYVYREIVYYGIITPPSTYNCRETIGGTVYSGTLTLYKYRHVDEKTYGFYKGMIYPQG